MRDHARRSELLVAAMVAALLAVPVAAQEAPYCPVDPDGRIANVFYDGTRVFFEPLVEHERLVLTVITPCSTVVREFKPGDNVVFDVREAVGELDGSYSWELRVVPLVDPAARKALEKSREGGDPLTLLTFQQKGLLPKGPFVDSAAFTVLDGAIVPPDEEEGREGKSLASQTSGTRFRNGAGLTPTTAADQVIPDDLIVQGSACVGFDCVNNESFGFDTIRMKENNTRIQFNDTSVGSFPTNNWQIRANSSASGGANFLGFVDQNASDTGETGDLVFAVTAGAPANSMFVSSAGRIGFKTSAPVLDLHISSSNTPGIRLEQTSAGGFTAQTWDIGANEANFFVRDVTGGSRLPFRIRPDAPTSSIDISADGDVGIGTASPQSKLDVDSGKITIGGHNIGERASDATDLEAQSLRNTIYGIDSDNNSTNAAFIVSRNGDLTQQIFVAREDNLVGINRSTPSFPLHVGTDGTNGNGAHVTALGIWTNGSSRVNKTNIRPLDAQDAFAALVGLEPVRYTGKNSPDGEEYLGFIAEDVPDLVAMNHRTGLSPMDIVAMLTKVVQEQQRTIEVQQQSIQALSARVDALGQTPVR